MNIDTATIVQGVCIVVIAGLIKDHFAIRAKLSTFITHETMREIEGKIDHKLDSLGQELRQIAEDLAYLRGKSGG